MQIRCRKHPLGPAELSAQHRASGEGESECEDKRGEDDELHSGLSSVFGCFDWHQLNPDAAFSLCSASQGDRHPSRSRISAAPVYGWFTEGFDTLDLKNAKALLDELA